MDFFQISLAAGIVLGFILIIVSYIKGKSSEEAPKETVSSSPPAFSLDRKIEAIDTTISEADNVLTELNDMSKNVFKEIDHKYNELLFLYNLIDEKKKEVEHYEPGKAPIPDISDISPSLEDIGKVNEYVSDNPRLSKIMELRKKGMSVPQIAKELDMGQGEVTLIMGLFGNRKKK